MKVTKPVTIESARPFSWHEWRRDTYSLQNMEVRACGDFPRPVTKPHRMSERWDDVFGIPGATAVTYWRGEAEVSPAVAPIGSEIADAYTDRLASWDRAKYDAVCEKHIGKQSWLGWIQSAPAEAVCAFVAEALGMERCTGARVVRYTDGGGYPVYRLDGYASPQKTETPE